MHVTVIKTIYYVLPAIARNFIRCLAAGCPEAGIFGFRRIICHVLAFLFEVPRRNL